jgi:type II secretion system (T2SS) protein G
MFKITRRRLVLSAATAVAVAIAVILYLFFVGGYHGSGHPRRVTEATLKVVGFNVNEYRKRTGRFPSSEEVFKVLYPNEQFVPTDGWRRSLVYRNNNGKASKPFSLYSIGANGIDEGGAGDDLDFWQLKE